MYEPLRPSVVALRTLEALWWGGQFLTLRRPLFVPLRGNRYVALLLLALWVGVSAYSDTLSERGLSGGQALFSASGEAVFWVAFAVWLTRQYQCDPALGRIWVALAVVSTWGWGLAALGSLVGLAPWAVALATLALLTHGYSRILRQALPVTAETAVTLVTCGIFGCGVMLYLLTGWLFGF